MEAHDNLMAADYPKYLERMLDKVLGDGFQSSKPWDGYYCTFGYDMTRDVSWNGYYCTPDYDMTRDGYWVGKCTFDDLFWNEYWATTASRSKTRPPNDVLKNAIRSYIKYAKEMQKRLATIEPYNLHKVEEGIREHAQFRVRIEPNRHVRKMWAQMCNAEFDFRLNFVPLHMECFSYPTNDAENTQASGTENSEAEGLKWMLYPDRGSSPSIKATDSTYPSRYQTIHQVTGSNGEGGLESRRGALTLTISSLHPQVMETRGSGRQRLHGMMPGKSPSATHDVSSLLNNIGPNPIPIEQPNVLHGSSTKKRDSGVVLCTERGNPISLTSPSGPGPYSKSASSLAQSIYKTIQSILPNHSPLLLLAIPSAMAAPVGRSPQDKINESVLQSLGQLAQSLVPWIAPTFFLATSIVTSELFFHWRYKNGLASATCVAGCVYIAIHGDESTSKPLMIVTSIVYLMFHASYCRLTAKLLNVSETFGIAATVLAVVLWGVVAIIPPFKDVWEASSGLGYAQALAPIHIATFYVCAVLIEKIGRENRDDQRQQLVGDVVG